MIVAHQKLRPPQVRASTNSPALPPEGASDSFHEQDENWAPISRANLLHLQNPTQSAVRADDYSAKFDRTEGWTGADGTYSVALPSGDTLWLFSDTFWGGVAPDGRRAPGTRFINNSVAVQSPSGEISFHHGGKGSEPGAVFTPPDGRGWFWLHDAVVQDSGEVTVMLGQFEKTGEDALDFKNVGAWLADLEMTESGPRVSGYQKLPDFGEDVFYGACVMEEEAQLYLYGVRDKGAVKESVLARVEKSSLSDPNRWEFFDGEGWTKESSEARPIVGDVSNEYSVHRAKSGDYVMTSQGGFFSPRVEIRRAPSPEGPWSEAVTVWSAPEQNSTDIAYNAKAHPELSDESGLLVSYNMNTLDWERNLSDADIYRPRFIRVTDPELLPYRTSARPFPQ